MNEGGKKANTAEFHRIKSDPFGCCQRRIDLLSDSGHISISALTFITWTFIQSNCGAGLHRSIVVS